MACCPVAPYAAVGTASGNVLFVDLKRERQPRLVLSIRLSHPVDHLMQVSPFPGVSFSSSKHVLQKQSVCCVFLFLIIFFIVLTKGDTIFSPAPQILTSLL